MHGLFDHLGDVIEKGYGDNLFGIFAFGSVNYKLDYENSDLDTKLIVLPTLKDICLAKRPVSTVIVRDNNEHIEVKDLRLIDFLDTMLYSILKEKFRNG